MANLAGIEFPYGCVWENEFAGSQAKLSKKTALDGTLHIQTFIAKKGQKMTVDARWLQDDAINQLKALCDSAAQMLLTLVDGRQINVMFDSEQTDPIDVNPVAKIADRTAFTGADEIAHIDKSYVTLYLMMI